MCNIVRMPHYSKTIDREFNTLLETMINKMGDKFRKQALLALHKSTIDKFSDAQTGNYATVFTKLARQVTRKLISQFSNEKIESYAFDILNKANKYNQNETYKAMEKALGINLKTLIAKESLSPAINALIIETEEWLKKLRDDTLQRFTTNSLRAMALGRDLDGVMEEFDLSLSKQKEAAKFTARNQLSNFNGILTKIRFQKVGVKKGKWQTSEDEKVRPCHRKRNGMIFDLNKGCYSSCDGKYLYPGTDYNCRCLLIALLDEFEE